jgi:hypothetical protein
MRARAGMNSRKSRGDGDPIGSAYVASAFGLPVSQRELLITSRDN